jgi:hypothetical protein
MKTLDPQIEFKRAARLACLGQSRYGGRGRTDGRTSVTMSTPVIVIPDSTQAPTVKGLGYWKTNFSGPNGFSKTLYTPSTFRIEVGANWKA